MTGDYLAAADAVAGSLDFDSNAGCVIDGRRQENIIYTQGPPSRPSTPFASTPSRCAVRSTRSGGVSATLADGTPLGYAQWEATDTDTRGNHVAGAGPAGVHVYIIP